MSYDLMVFNKNSAPKTRDEFMEWYNNQTEWTEDHSYFDPEVTSKELKDWLMEMIQTFPALNGPFYSDDEDYDYDNENVSDYSIGRDVIYVGFSWSVVEKAYEKAFEIAEKYEVGFFDPSFETGIFFPINGKLIKIEEFNSSEKDSINKPWWKFW